MSFREVCGTYGLDLDPQYPSEYTGCIDGDVQYNQFIDDLKVIGISFSTTASRSSKVDKVGFSGKMPYCGMPFFMEKVTYKSCILGGSYRQFADKASTNAHSTKKRTKQATKKIGCPATMTVRCMRVFQEECYKSKALTYTKGSYEMHKILQKLKQDLRTSSPPIGMLRYVINISQAEVHNHTVVSSKLNGIIHPHLQQQIHSFVGNNIRSTNTMKIHLEEVVRHKFEKENRPTPDKLNRSYYPSDHVIRFHMHKSLLEITQSRSDQDALEKRVNTWESGFSEDKFKDTSSDDDNLDTCSARDEANTRHEDAEDQLPVEDSTSKMQKILQENVKLISCYSFLQFSAENLKTLVEMSENLKQTMLNVGEKSDEGLLLHQPDVTQVVNVSTTKRTYADLPKRNRLKTNSK